MIYEPGDYVSGIGAVDSNHCGLPWVAYMDQKTMESGLMYGSIAVTVLENHGKYGYGHIVCDAISGKPLDKNELNERRNNLTFDYGNRSKNNLGRRYPNNPPAELMRQWNWLQLWLARQYICICRFLGKQTGW